MKLSDIIILSLSIVLFVIGIHQMITFGLGAAYGILMFSIGLLLYYKYRKQKRSQEVSEKDTKTKSKQ